MILSQMTLIKFELEFFTFGPIEDQAEVCWDLPDIAEQLGINDHSLNQVFEMTKLVKGNRLLRHLHATFFPPTKMIFFKFSDGLAKIIWNLSLRWLIS